LEECIFNSDHNRGESSVILNSDGKICYHCFHNSCQGKTWKEAREKLEGGPRKFFCKFCNSEIEWKEKNPFNLDGTEHRCQIFPEIDVDPLIESLLNPLDTIEEQMDIPLSLKGIHPVFENYLSHFSGKTEAPVEYTATAFLGSLAGAIGNNLTLGFGSSGLKANLYLILIGKSSFSKKSTSLNCGLISLKKLNGERMEKYKEAYTQYKGECEEYQKLTKQEKKEASCPKKPLNNRIILPEEITPEALVSALQEKSDGMFVYSEMGSLLSKLKYGGYSSGLKEMLTNFYDCPEDYSRETRKDGFIYIKSPCPTILGASTFQWLQTYLEDLDLFSGFLARFCFVVQRGYPNIDIPFPKPINLDSEWLDLFKKLSEKILYLKISKEAEKSYSDRYGVMKEKAINSESALHGFKARLLTTCHKIAMINHVLSVCYDDLEDRPKNETVIEAKSYERAYPWMEFFNENIESCVSELTQTKNYKEIKVLEVIGREKDGIIAQSKLLKNTNFKNMKELNEIMEILIGKNWVRKIGKGKNRISYEVAKKR